MALAPPAVNSPVLEEIVRRLVEVYHPERIYLFGSAARGEAGPHSDYDLLIIQQSDQPRYACSGVYYRALADLPAEVDVLVYTPQEVEQWRSVPQAFVTTALREGVVLYERKG